MSIFFIIFSERDVVFSLMFFIKLKRKKSTEIYSIHNIQLLIFHCKVLRECVLSGELAVSVVSRSISLCIFFRFKLFFKLANVWIVNKQDVSWFFLQFHSLHIVTERMFILISPLLFFTKMQFQWQSYLSCLSCFFLCFSSSIYLRYLDWKR